MAHFNNLNEPIDVIAYFTIDEQIQPLRIRSNKRNKIYRIKKVNAQWRADQGRDNPYLFFSLTTTAGENLEIAFEIRGQAWRLKAINDLTW